MSHLNFPNISFNQIWKERINQLIPCDTAMIKININASCCFAVHEERNVFKVLQHDKITWNDPFAILTFPLSKLVFNSLWNDNNFFRAFLLLYTIFKERLNLKPRKKTFISLSDLFIVTETVPHYSSTLFSLFSHTILLFLNRMFLCHKNERWWNFQLIAAYPYEKVMFCRVILCFWYSFTKRLLWEKYNLFIFLANTRFVK